MAAHTVISSIPSTLRLEGDGADGTANDHDGRDVRDVTIFRVAFVVVVAIVPGTRQPSVVVHPS